MIKCLIIDDERPAIDVIQNYIMQIPLLQLVGTSTNPVQGIEMIRSRNAELVFLDVQMDEMNGIDVAKHLGKGIKIIFCTAYSEFAVASFDLDVVDYLMKPLSFDRFKRAVDRALGALGQPLSFSQEREIPNDYLFIKIEHKGKMIKVDLADIDFIEGKNNLVAFHAAGKMIPSRYTLRGLAALLPKNSFIRVHKSYIVPIKKIASVVANEIMLYDHAQPIPLGASFRDAFMLRVSEKLIS